MYKANGSKKDKKILLAFLLLATIFMLGCGIKGNEPEKEPVRYEFCVGKYTVSSSRYDNMFYAACNQESGSGFIIDSNGNNINGSGFSAPINPCISDDNRNIWVADGFYSFEKPSDYPNGKYALKLNCWNSNIEKSLDWNGIPEWKSLPNIQYNKDTNFIEVYNFHGVTSTEASKNLSVRYRIKVYAAGKQTARLFGQSKSTKETNYISYTLPRKMSQSTISLVPVLVAELYDNRGIQMILFYPGNAITY